MTGDYVLETVFECNDDVINGYHEIACRVKMTNIDFIRFNAQQFITNMLTNTNRIFLLVCSILVYYLMRDESDRAQSSAQYGHETNPLLAGSPTD